MTRTPTVSVVIPSTGDMELLSRSAESVAAQRWTDRELIVVDDSGADRVDAERLPPGTRVARHSHRGGPAAARNTALGLARGGLVAFLDHDDVWLPEKLETQVAHLAAHPSAALTYCHYTSVDYELRPVARQVAPRLPTSDPLRRILRSNFIKSASLVLARRDVLRDLDGFDTRLRGADDWDLWMRLVAQHPTHADPEPRVLYRLHEGQYSRDERRMYRDAVRVLEKNGPLVRRVRPDLDWYRRRRVTRILAKWAAVERRRGSHAVRVLALLRRAVRTWPWDPAVQASCAVARLRALR